MLLPSFEFAYADKVQILTEPLEMFEEWVANSKEVAALK